MTGSSASWRSAPARPSRSSSTTARRRRAYPVAIEQGYAVARWIMREGAAHALDPDRMAVAGDSVGGCMAAALTLMAEGRGDVRFVHQSLYYPVTDAAMDTASYEQFAEGYYLTAKAMAWFWDAYAPDPETRAASRMRPRCARRTAARRAPARARDRRRVRRPARRGRGVRRAPAGERGRRDDGPLRRHDHDFMMLNPLSGSHATRAAIAQAISVLRVCTLAMPPRYAGRGRALGPVR